MNQEPMEDKPLKKIIRFLYGPIISVVYFIMQTYKANRERLDNFLNNKKISSILQFIAVAILIIWIIVFVSSTEEDRKALTEQIKQGFDEWQSTDSK